MDVAKSSQGDLTDLKPRRYKPTVILFPSAASGVWKEEIARYFPCLDVVYYLGQPTKGTMSEREKVLGTSAKDLVVWLRDLDSDDIQTERTVVFSTYSTWHIRTFTKQGKAQDHLSTSRYTQPTKATKDTHEELSEPDDQDGESEMDDNDIILFQTHIPKGLIRRIICDEGHRLKAPRTKTCQSVIQAEPELLVLLTATTMINTVTDLHGQLTLFTRGFRDLEGFDELSKYDEALASIEDFDRSHDPMEKLTDENLRPLLPVLEPRTFKRMSRDTSDDSLSMRTQRIIPPILKLIQLRKTMADTMMVNGLEIRIGSTIPKYHIYTVELSHTPISYDKYRKATRNATQLGVGKVRGTDEGFLNQTALRTLTQACLNPDLAALFGMTTDTVTSEDLAWNDHGVSFLFERTKDPLAPIYRDRISMSLWLTRFSPKLKALAAIAGQVCSFQGTKLLVFVSWPASVWHVVGLLLNLGFNVASIEAGHSSYERDEVVKAFNIPSSPIQILVTSLRVGATSSNLQKACHHLVFLDVPSAANTMIQAIGRLFRIGQKHEAIVWILTVNLTYDQRLQYTAARKMIPQIAGTAALKATKVEATRLYDKAHPRKQDTSEDEPTVLHGGEEGADRPIDVEQAPQTDYHSEMLDNECAEIYRVLVGQRSHRHSKEWKDHLNPKAKNSLKGEQEYKDKLAREKGADSQFKKDCQKSKLQASHLKMT